MACDRGYRKPTLERFGTFRELTKQQWPVLHDWETYCREFPDRCS